MPYTVTRKGGIGEYELEAYVRQLTRWGISLGRAPRVPDPQTGRRWLPVWQERKTAEKFVQDLCKEEDYDDWRIEKVPASAVSEGALGPLDVYVGRGEEGLTYALHPNSRTLVRQRFPHTLLLQSVSVDPDDLNDFEQNQTVAQDRVVQLLTGLSGEQLEELGGYRIYDPVRDRVVREAPPLPGPAPARAG
jgi:hypothetical protein